MIRLSGAGLSPGGTQELPYKAWSRRSSTDWSCVCKPHSRSTMRCTPRLGVTGRADWYCFSVHRWIQSCLRRSLCSVMEWVTDRSPQSPITRFPSWALASACLVSVLCASNCCTPEISRHDVCNCCWNTPFTTSWCLVYCITWLAVWGMPLWWEAASLGLPLEARGRLINQNWLKPKFCKLQCAHHCGAWLLISFCACYRASYYA